MVKSAALKARVEDRIGAALPADVFDQAEQYARRKLALINARAGRQYGEDGYGDEYLVILAVEIVRGMALTAYLNRKGGGRMRRRKEPLPKWVYAFSCRKCQNIQFVHDEAKGRDGDYCVKAIERTDAGLPGPIHADDDRVVRCDCFSPIPEEGDPG